MHVAPPLATPPVYNDVQCKLALLGQRLHNTVRAKGGVVGRGAVVDSTSFTLIILSDAFNRCAGSGSMVKCHDGVGWVGGAEEDHGTVEMFVWRAVVLRETFTGQICWAAPIQFPCTGHAVYPIHFPKTGLAECVASFEHVQICSVFQTGSESKVLTQSRGRLPVAVDVTKIASSSTKNQVARVQFTWMCEASSLSESDVARVRLLVYTRPERGWLIDRWID